MRVAIIHDGYNFPQVNPESCCQRDLIKELKEALNSVGYETGAIPCLNDISEFMEKLRSFNPDVVFNICESIWARSGNEMKMASILETMGLPYTGSGPIALGLAQDKGLSKYILKQAGVPTPEFRVIREFSELESIAPMEFPVIVKPSQEDGSAGIDEDAVTNSEEELRQRVRFVLDAYREPALVEKFVDGRELNVPLLGKGKYEVFPISEIIFRKGEKVCGYNAKWVRESDEYKNTVPRCPAELAGDQKKIVEEAAKKSAKVHKCRGYARIDIRLGTDGIPYVIDVNPNPDLSRSSGLARSARAAGLSYPELIQRIVNIALT